MRKALVNIVSEYGLVSLLRQTITWTNTICYEVLPEHMLTYCQLDHQEQTLVKFENMIISIKGNAAESVVCIRVATFFTPVN